MNLARWREAWERFFFSPQDPTPMAIFRILYGICVTMTLVLLHSEWLDWFGVHSWVTLQTMRTVEPGLRLNLFTVMPQSDAWITAFFWVSLGFAVLLTVGLWTRLSSIAVFMCLASIQQRNLYILHGGDVFLRVTGFFLMFAPAGAALSIDRLIRVHRRLEGVEIEPRAPWAQRMIQFELALLYFASFLWKIKGAPWLNGTALFYVFHIHDIQRFPLPVWMQQPWILKLATWYTLALEFSLGVLIWFRPFRYPLLLLGLLFHLCIEYSLNIPMFEWDVLTAYVLFIDPADVKRMGRAAHEFFLRSSRRASAA
ncbi:MAG: HTTM domain-containing protein [Acidobacteriota bacterium]